MGMAAVVRGMVSNPALSGVESVSKDNLPSLTKSILSVRVIRGYISMCLASLRTRRHSESSL